MTVFLSTNKKAMTIIKSTWCSGCSSVVEHTSTIHSVLGSSPCTTKQGVEGIALDKKLCEQNLACLLREPTHWQTASVQIPAQPPCDLD